MYINLRELHTTKSALDLVTAYVLGLYTITARKVIGGNATFAYAMFVENTYYRALRRRQEY